MQFDYQPLIERLRTLSEKFEFASNHTNGLERLTRGASGHPCDSLFLTEARRIEHEAEALSERVDKFLGVVKKRAAVEVARSQATQPPTSS